MTVLVCIEDFSKNGATQSLQWFLQWLASCDLSVTLFLYADSGERPSWLPTNVTVKGLSAVVTRSRLGNLLLGRTRGRLGLKLWWQLVGQRLIVSRWPGAPAWLLRLFRCDDTRYDVAISYCDDYCNRFVRTFLATRYWGWNHEDYGMIYRTERERGKVGRYLRRLDLVWCVSQTSRDALVHGLGIPEARVRVLHNMVPCATASTSVQKEPADIADGGALRILSMGRLEAVKNFRQCLDVASRLRELGVRFVWEIYGDGSLDRELRKAIRDLGLANHVRMLSWPGRPDEILGMAQCYVQPSLNEGWGIMVMKAAFLGVPRIVVSDIPVFREQQALLGLSDGRFRVCRDTADYVDAIKEPEPVKRGGGDCGQVERRWAELLKEEQKALLQALQGAPRCGVQR